MHGRILNALRAVVAGSLRPFSSRSLLFAVRRDNPIAHLRFRLGALLLLRECLRLFFAWIMVWAAAVVALRALFQVDQFLMLWGLVGLLVAAAAGAILARRKIPTATALRALLDRHGSLGGLLMAAGDTDIGRWQQRIALVPIPTLRWRSGRQWMLFLISTGFLVAALFGADRYLPAGDTALEVGGEVQKLSDKLQVLKQEQIVPPERAQVMEKDLDRLHKDALGKDPAKTMETLDHLEQSFSKAAADAAESAIKQTEKVSRGQELADALEAARSKMDPRQFGEAMKELARLAGEAAAESKALSDSLSDELKDALQQGKLTDEQLRELSKALGQCKALDREMLAKLVRAKLVDVAALERCDKAGDCDEGALIAALGDCHSDQQLAEALNGDGLPGRGGVNRGRGDAAMIWQDEVQKKDAAFKEKVLPPGAAASLKQSRLAGISTGDPTAKQAGGGSASGALGAARAGGGEARTQLILPEHEKTVQRYFSREKK